jgi:isoquinoline 1-oxidoreductase beta subunit
VVLATLEAACRSDAGEALMATPSEREASAALERATRRLEATYVAPFLMHAQIEPMNAPARADAARAELWLPTQAQSRMRADVAQALGIDPAAVTIHPTLVGGGFGRRLETDYGVTAALIARKLGRPVKVIWSREQDSLQARLRPAAATRFIGAFDREGRLTYLGSQTACVDREPRVRGLRDIPYAVPFRVVRYSAGEPFGRCGQWRSVDLSQNTFFLESFIDECAAASASDPLDFRRMLLAHDPRSSRVLDTLERLCDWRNARRDGRHLGMAFLQGFDSISAQAVQVEVTPKGGVRVRRVFVVVDCGTAVNPRNVAAQVEGGVLFGLSAALAEEVTIVGGEIQQHNFDAYRLLSMSQSAQVTVEILESPDAPIGGVGELGVPPVAPALANALYAATGNRVRRLPLTRSGSLTA